MILRSLLILSIFFTSLFSLATSSDDKYKVYESDKYSIIYTPFNEKEALYIKNNLDAFLKRQDESFGFSFDEPFIISLISPNIQIANAFSTQIPFNETIFYGGGVSYIDYFSSSSWLDTLLYHEIAHNYQINSKNNEVSKTLHKTLGNNFMPLFVPIPLFTMPNLLIPTALLEGDAVLNESIHGNGGRLYNGRFKALTNLLILNNKMNKTIFLNDHIDFPYTEEKYIVGGYFMLYLAQKYGVDKVNKFFEEHSKHFINPLLLNNSFNKHFNDSFNNLFYYFIKDSKKNMQDFKVIDNKNFISESKREIFLSKQNEQILFLTNDNITKPILNIYDIKTNQKTTKTGNWLNGKVFKIDDKYFTTNSAFIKPSLYKNGLFDENSFIKKETTGKFIQDLNKNNTLYFDVNSSFDTPSLYLNDKFYAKANSSALFDKKGNIYYFKQEKNKRVLYKNKTALFSFEGYFSKVVEIKDENIYFIANSKNGSSLYKYDGTIYRVSEFENIIDAKILDDKTALLVSINHDNYRVYKKKLKAKKDEVFVTKLNIKEKVPFGDKKIDLNKTITSNKYNEFKQLDFSFLTPSFAYDSEDGSLYTLNAYFFDPLMFNALQIYAYKLADERFVGFNYINERTIPFEINLYDNSKDTPSSIDRGWGGYIKLYGPLYKAGNHVNEIEVKNYFDDENEEKNPFIIINSHNYTLDFGLSFYPYFKSNLDLYLKEDRDDIIYGLSLDLNHHLFDETYLHGAIKTIQSDTSSLINKRGIKVHDDLVASLDESDVYSAGIDNDFYVKDITKTSIGISKTFNLNKYFFNFPLSLRRESIYFKYNNYEYTQTNKDNFYEKIVGITFDTLFIHKLALPIDIKYIENSSSKNDNSVLLSIGLGF